MHEPKVSFLKSQDLVPPISIKLEGTALSHEKSHGIWRSVFHCLWSRVWLPISDDRDEPPKNIKQPSEDNGVTKSYSVIDSRTKSVMRYQRNSNTNEQNHKTHKHDLPSTTAPKRWEFSPSVHVYPIYEKTKSSAEVCPRQGIEHQQEGMPVLFPLKLPTSTTERTARVVLQAVLLHLLSVHVDAIFFAKAADISS